MFKLEREAVGEDICLGSNLSVVAPLHSSKRASGSGRPTAMVRSGRHSVNAPTSKRRWLRLTGYIESAEQAIQSEIASFAQHAEEDWEKSRSKLRQTTKQLRIEFSITIQLKGELTRLEAGSRAMNHSTVYVSHSQCPVV
jgi:hypothetical protein